MAEEAKSGGWLSKVFWGAVKIATVVLVANVAWQMFLDPLFFPVIHDTTNAVSQAWTAMINDNFGWIPRHAGLTKETGLLTGIMKAVLGDRVKAYETPSDEVVTTVSEAVSDLLSPVI
jgi:hypothetical protein